MRRSLPLLLPERLRRRRLGRRRRSHARERNRRHGRMPLRTEARVRVRALTRRRRRRKLLRRRRRIGRIGQQIAAWRPVKTPLILLPLTLSEGNLGGFGRSCVPHMVAASVCASRRVCVRRETWVRGRQERQGERGRGGQGVFRDRLGGETRHASQRILFREFVLPRRKRPLRGCDCRGCIWSWGRTGRSRGRDACRR